MNFEAFKFYDIRGEYPSQVNEELAYRVGRAVVRKLSAKTIVVGRDMRTSSPSLAEEIIRGISSEGADVINLGMCTTPMLSFAVAHYGYDGGIMVSASHNPGKDNAFKIIGPKALMIDADAGLLDIKEIIQKGLGPVRKQGAVTKKEILQDYLAHILSKIKNIGALKVVVDYGNGVGSISAKPAFARFDLDITELNAEPDGTFPAHPANPHDIDNFNQLVSEVSKQKADLGVFFDGDADRALFVDETGSIVPIDLLTVLLAEELLRKKPKERIYYDLRFSKSVKEKIKEMGGEPIMLKVGNPTYKRALLEKGGLMGAEFSGHLMFGENYNLDDGLFATLKTLELLSLRETSLSELIASVKTHEAMPEMSLEATNPEDLLDRIVDAFPEGKSIELDGAYIDLSDGFISVRKSQSEPHLFRVRVEASDKDTLNIRLGKIIKILHE